MKITLLTLLFATSAWADSPYFFVEGGDAQVDRLPLKDTHVHFDVTGVIADVTVRQTYTNEGKRPISAKYVFPASTRAAVHGMKMVIGERVIEAKIRERQKARDEFEKAKAEGKSASLLEQDRPNVFTMNVANVLPGDRIDVELHYTELLVPSSGVYEFVYPTVVGPRYSNDKSETPGIVNRFIKSAYTHEGELPSYTFGLDGAIHAGVPVSEITSPTHKIRVGGADINLDDKAGGNRDFILHYRLTGERIASGLSLYKGGDENFFMLMVQPPKRVQPELIPPREYVFIVDVSGSMWGFPLDVSKKLLRELIGSLRPTDRFNVLLFSGGSRLMAPESVPATQSNITTALAILSNQQGGGGTELLPAVERAMSLPVAQENVARSFIVITDGYIAEERGVFDFVREHLGQTSVFAFGIGSSVNRYLIEGVARAGLGEPFIVTNQDEAKLAGRRFAEYVRSPVLTDVKLSIDGFDAYDVSPRRIPTLFSDRPVIVHGKWRGKPTGVLTLSGKSGQGDFSSSVDVASVAPSEVNHPLKYLWARTRIDDLSAIRGDAEQEITELGLKYSLLTQYTSFVAVHQVVRRGAQDGADVEQPLPMPEGVSDSAIEGGAEPTLPLFALLACGALFLVHRKRVAA